MPQVVLDGLHSTKWAGTKSERWLTFLSNINIGVLEKKKNPDFRKHPWAPPSCHVKLFSGHCFIFPSMSSEVTPCHQTKSLGTSSTTLPTHMTSKGCACSSYLCLINSLLVGCKCEREHQAAAWTLRLKSSAQWQPAIQQTTSSEDANQLLSHEATMSIDLLSPWILPNFRGARNLIGSWKLVNTRSAFQCFSSSPCSSCHIPQCSHTQMIHSHPWQPGQSALLPQRSACPTGCTVPAQPCQLLNTHLIALEESQGWVKLSVRERLQSKKAKDWPQSNGGDSGP